MRGFGTPMTIGAVGGLALIAAIHHLAPSLLPSVLPGQPTLIAEGLICTASAIAATWPDIDESGSWLSQRVATALTLLGGVCGGAVALACSMTAQGAAFGRSWSALLAIGILGGLILGGLVGKLLRRLIRVGAGGPPGGHARNLRRRHPVDYRNIAQTARPGHLGDDPTRG